MTQMNTDKTQTSQSLGLHLRPSASSADKQLRTLFRAKREARHSEQL